jgi:prepilin-type N-terminal cleavage/methylation domain-containing protein
MMRNLRHSLCNPGGFTLMEILITMIVIAISTGSFIWWQRVTWDQTKKSNRTMVAGHIIEKQIEARRLTISQNPTANYAAFKALPETTIVDNSVKPSVKVRWVISPTYDPTGVEIAKVRRVELIASWGSTKADSLRVVTCISEKF